MRTGISHTAAHDTLSDVRATIALARLIRQHQPKLFEFCLALHKKERVSAEIDTLSENTEERGQEVLDELYDYAEMIAPVRH